MIIIFTFSIIITFSIIFLYNKFLINYTALILEVRNKTLINISPLFISIISIVLIYKKTFTPFAYIVLFFAYMIVFKIIFSESIGSIYNIIICQIFYMIVNRDIFIGILSILSGQSMNKTIQSYETYIISFALCILLMMVFLIKFKHIYDVNTVKNLLINKKKLQRVTLTITSLVIILININYTYYYSGDVISTIYILIINIICINFCFLFSINMAIKSIKWIEEESFYKTSLMSIQYNEETNIDADKYLNILKMYNHDFKDVLFNINDAIEIGDIEKVKYIISEFNNDIDNITNYNKKLSNNSLVNSLLNRLLKKCDDKNIYCELDCYIPSNIIISELELIKVFNNLSSNAFEACIKQDKQEEKMIIFKSYVKGNKFIIYQVNSFNGDIKFKNNKLITSKNNKKIHGIGIESIKHIVNKVNGIFLIKIDNEKREFKICIKIPVSIRGSVH